MAAPQRQFAIKSTVPPPPLPSRKRSLLLDEMTCVDRSTSQIFMDSTGDRRRVINHFLIYTSTDGHVITEKWRSELFRCQQCIGFYPLECTKWFPAKVGLGTRTCVGCSRPPQVFKKQKLVDEANSSDESDDEIQEPYTSSDSSEDE